MSRVAQCGAAAVCAERTVECRGATGAGSFSDREKPIESEVETFERLADVLLKPFDAERL